MTSFEGEWSRAEAEAFLERALVPVRLGCHHTRGGLWMLSLWYRYRDGRIECATPLDADIVSFLDADDSVCFEISTNRPPYMGVRGNGTATVNTDGGEDVLRALVDQYLGGTDSELAGWLLRDDRTEAVLEIEPSRLYTWDFTPRMADIEDSPAAADPEPPSPKYKR